ncbi:hypothetical protein D3C71_1986130 [compost metagenome]
MLTGRIDGNGPDLVPKNRSWLAALLLIVVLAFGAWEWQQSPNGLLERVHDLPEAAQRSLRDGMQGSGRSG